MKKNRMKELRAKLDGEKKAAAAVGKYAGAVMPSLIKALEVFAEQDEEFADAVLDGSLVACAKVIEKALSGKHSVSDLDVYRMAAGHYFPGAEVEFQMVVRVNPYGGAVEADKPTVNKRINLLDLM